MSDSDEERCPGDDELEAARQRLIRRIVALGGRAPGNRRPRRLATAPGTAGRPEVTQPLA